MKNSSRNAIAVIIVHLVVSIVHGLAHTQVGIDVSRGQGIFIGGVITAPPLIAGFLLWRGSIRPGGILLAFSMAGALVFGIYFHFIFESPDNVWHTSRITPPGWFAVFEFTAFLLAALELYGVVLGVRLFAKSGS